METLNGGEYALKNLSRINIVLGKNGTGKSTLLRQIEQYFSQQQAYGNSKYITPERGGDLVYTSGIDENIFNNVSWLSGDRRKNQTTSFRQQSVSQYVKLENIVLREFEDDQNKSKFYPYITKINSLLDNIEIVRAPRAFKIFSKSSKQELRPSQISSGESELISLGIECLIFCKECVSGRENILFLDEPDVHLHPDLQVRLMKFLENLLTEYNFRVLIATHSTAILGALESYSNIHIGFMTFNQKVIDFVAISDIYKKVLPVFGAHPLSNIFSRAPIWLVEGEDDERIWQQIVRSSAGRMKIYPCSVDGINNMNSFEQETGKILKSVYDDARGYSLRDRDGGQEEINDMLPIVRMKLSCRSSENLLLCDEVLKYLNISWEQLQKSIDKWIELRVEHPHYNEIKCFKDCGYDRKNHDIKIMRNDLMGIIGSPKPWEIAVGKTIATVLCLESTNSSDGGVLNYLGDKVVKNLTQILNS